MDLPELAQLLVWVLEWQQHTHIKDKLCQFQHGEQQKYVTLPILRIGLLIFSILQLHVELV
jgi:hypothetical protein